MSPAAKSLLGRLAAFLFAILAGVVGLVGVARLLERASLADEFVWGSW